MWCYKLSFSSSKMSYRKDNQTDNHQSSSLIYGWLQSTFSYYTSLILICSDLPFLFLFSFFFLFVFHRCFLILHPNIITSWDNVISFSCYLYLLMFSNPNIIISSCRWRAEVMFEARFMKNIVLKLRHMEVMLEHSS